MRLNFTGRRKIEKQDARVVFRDDPLGSKRGHYFELELRLDEYKLPADARVFVEATRGLVLMRFDLGSVGARATLAPEARRLSEFAPDPDGVRLRVKVVQPDGPEAGKLLAEADGLTPDDGGISPLIYISGADLGALPWRLNLVPTDPHLPELQINKALGGKEYAKDPVAKPLLMTAVAREVFAELVWHWEEELDAEHWASRWKRFAEQVLKVGDMPSDEDEEDHIRAWTEAAVAAFASKFELAQGLATFKANLELQSLDEMN